MPIISSKRQITLPADQCRTAGINPGDEYVSFVDNLGHISIIKKIPGAASGLLKDIKIDKRLSDETSLHSAITS
jgi:bifunctional DNA-binding transcriptional regulator/antitoxin component of YhaV-PrlF toxin-antitoxin module